MAGGRAGGAVVIHARLAGSALHAGLAALAGVVLVALTPAAWAHPLAPALLELREQAPGSYAVQWRTSVARVGRVDVTPQLPEACRETSPVESGVVDGEAFVARWTVACGELVGKTFGVSGLEASGINVILRLEARDGTSRQVLLDARGPSHVVPAAMTDASAPTRSSVFGEYLALGVKHLLGGLDHVLFILGLVMLVTGLRALVVMVTAFTVGHSVSLALAVLGFIEINPALAELGIALSLVAVALAIARNRAARHAGTGFPGKLTPTPAFAAGFGVIHGLGFAAALEGAGLPAGEVPLALVAFNVGIEIGQLGQVGALLTLAALTRSMHAQPALQERLAWMPAYLIGSMAAFWCLERGLVLVG